MPYGPDLNARLSSHNLDNIKGESREDLKAKLVTAAAQGIGDNGARICSRRRARDDINAEKIGELMASLTRLICSTLRPGRRQSLTRTPDVFQLCWVVHHVHP